MVVFALPVVLWNPFVETGETCGIFCRGKEGFLDSTWSCAGKPVVYTTSPRIMPICLGWDELAALTAKAYEQVRDKTGMQ